MQRPISIPSPHPVRSILFPSVATAVVLTVLACLVQPLHAQSTKASASAQSREQLPALGNTAETDRLLLREISDTYVHTADSAFFTQLKRVQAAHQTPQITRSGNNSSPLNAWAAVRQSTRLDIPQHERVSNYLEQYRHEARWVSNILQRARPFVGYVVDELDKSYLPLELALLPAIESAYQPDVTSPKDAAGIWQIIPATARDIGVTHDAWFDGRADIQQSTRAAIDYLSYLNAKFHGDWLITLAAYNAGVGRVRNAIKRNFQAGKPTDFWSLQLPEETRNYVPKFLSLVSLLREEQVAGMHIPDVPRGSAFDVVDINARFSLDRIAELSRLPVRQLQQLNSGLIRGVTAPEGPHRVYVPQGFGEPLVNLLRARPGQALYTRPDTHEVVAGDNLSSLALRYGVTQGHIMALNELDSANIKIGQTLKVIDTLHKPAAINYVVSIGDTLSDIAHRYSVNLDDIRDAQGQNLGSSIIHPGETLTFLKHE